MIVYLVSCIVSAAIMYLGLQRLDKNSHKWEIALFSALPMIIVAAFRYDVGEDYLNTYVPYFEMVREGLLPANQQMELIYHFLNVIVARLHGDVVWVFAVSAILFYIPIYLFIVGESPMPVLSVFLLTGMGYVFIFFNAMRQLVGCGILLFSLRYVKTRRFIPFLICTAVAAGFHLSCLLFIIAYFLPGLHIKPALALILTVVVVAINGLITVFARNIISLSRYGLYLSSVFDTGKTAYVMLGMNLVILVFLMFCYRGEKEYQLFFNLQMIALWITFFSGKVVLSLRIFWMFGLPAVMSIPIALQTLPQEKDRKLGASVVVLLYLFYMLYTVGLQNSNSVLPYQTVFSRWL